MASFFKTHGTTFTVGLFMISAASGLLLLFHVGSVIFHGMHEWLSLLLLVPVGFHIWKNWLPLKMYFRRKTIWLPLAICLSLGVFFVAPALLGTSASGNPVIATLNGIATGTLEEIAPIYGATPTELRERLERKGFEVTSTHQSLQEIAAASGKDSGRDLIATIAFPE